MAESNLIDQKEKFTDHLLDTLREGCLVLDADQCVEKANSSFYRMFRAEPGETLGKTVYELGNGQWDIPELRRLLEEILPKQKMISDYEVEHTFEEIGHRVMLLNARRIDHAQIILLAIEDATERKQAMQQVEKANDRLEERVEERTREVRRLAARLTQSKQNERRRIAGILHDDLQQKLFAIRMRLNIMQQQVDPEGAAGQLVEKLADLLKLTDQAFEKTRQLSSDLDPYVLKSDRLTELLEWLVGRFEEVHNLKTVLQAEANLTIPDEEVRIVVLQIVRELLFNIIKHAGTDQAIIKVAESDEDHLVIHVIDEGNGFEVQEIDATGHYGLSSVRERLNLFGGDMEVNSNPEMGTCVRVIMPVGENMRFG